MNRRRISIRVLHFSAPLFSARPDFSNQTPENLREKTRIQLLVVRRADAQPLANHILRGSLRAGNVEIRNPNVEIRKKFEARNSKHLICPRFLIAILGFPSSFGFRISDFLFTHVGYGCGVTRAAVESVAFCRSWSALFRAFRYACAAASMMSVLTPLP